jgi:dienelactone hydrolase
MNIATWWSIAPALVIALGSTLTGAQQHGAFAPMPAGAHYVERELRVPVPGSGAAGLDALEVYINTPGKHPLALLTHGTSNSAEERLEVTPWAYLQQAVWFAEHGYVSLVIVRRGYGSSGGEQDGRISGCSSNGNFEEIGEAAADDLRNAVDYAARNMPEVDATHVISSGVSTGGFTQVALTAHPPRGLETAISFAGGRGGDGNGHVCNEGNFEAALHSFGKHSHTPMLWIYAENDKWFPPNFARRFLSAFQSGGGTAQFVLAPAFGEDGHKLYSDPRAWSATVENYLGERRLLPVSPAYPPPTPPKVDPPAELSERAADVFRSIYLGAGPHKAFATDGSGAYGYSTGQFTQQLADDHAMENCNQHHGNGRKCSVTYRGDSAVSGKNSGVSTPNVQQPRGGSGRTGP